MITGEKRNLRRIFLGSTIIHKVQINKIKNFTNEINNKKQILYLKLLRHTERFFVIGWRNVAISCNWVSQILSFICSNIKFFTCLITEWSLFVIAQERFSLLIHGNTKCNVGCCSADNCSLAVAKIDNNWQTFYQILIDRV